MNDVKVGPSELQVEAASEFSDPETHLTDWATQPHHNPILPLLNNAENHCAASPQSRADAFSRPALPRGRSRGARVYNLNGAPPRCVPPAPREPLHAPAACSALDSRYCVSATTTRVSPAAPAASKRPSAAGPRNAFPRGAPGLPIQG